MWCACAHRKHYEKFASAGCMIDKVRHTGEENRKLRSPERAKRFSLYLQVCCNHHFGKDFKYVLECDWSRGSKLNINVMTSIKSNNSMY